MVFASDSPFGGRFEQTIDDAVVHGDADMESALHEGPVRVLVNGWVEVPGGRYLSPHAVRHVDVRASE
ncbi:hypothetical protein [Haloferax volcanii]|uniref:hypothetical protein n=1 Tax=Haloferax volcanii TaxID=2246 RepID=UPI0023DC1AB3|nr:hypothetical protein [Haloferax lucentense]WEL24461.1 Uncharacterized protein SVXHx_0127 [Haloferax lucentense]